MPLRVPLLCCCGIVGRRQPPSRVHVVVVLSLLLPDEQVYRFSANSLNSFTRPSSQSVPNSSAILPQKRKKEASVFQSI